MAARRTIGVVVALFATLALAMPGPFGSRAIAQDAAAGAATGDDSGQVLDLPQAFTPAQQSCANPYMSSSESQNCPPTEMLESNDSDVQQYANQGQPADPSSAGDLNAYMNQGTAAESGAMGSPYGVGAPVFFPSYLFYGFNAPSAPRPVAPSFPPLRHGGGGIRHGKAR
jgi:hypothetical protein